MTSCAERCICQANGTFTCVPQMCPPVDGPPCTTYGDPHYTSWDGRRFDFHGTCEYVIAQFCGSDDVVISANNELCFHINTPVACLIGARVTLQNANPKEIFIESGQKLFFDGVLQSGNSQVYPSSGDIDIRRVGGRVHVSLPQHGLYMYYGGFLTLQVRVSTIFLGTNRLCGLGGNYNGDPSDDPTTAPPLQCPGGRERRVAPNSIVGCDNSSITIMAARERCGVIRTSSVFNICNAVVDPSPYIRDCEYDYCCGGIDRREEYICDTLSNYAAECALNGAQPSNWRGEFCRKFIYKNLNTVHCISHNSDQVLS